MTDELINGTVAGWPVSVMVMRNLGEKWVGLHVAPYTGEDDEPAPDHVWDAIRRIPEDHGTMAAAAKALLNAGFVADAEE